MHELRNGVPIITQDNQNTYDESGASAVDIYDNDNTWNPSEHPSNRQSLDAHWGAEKVYDYWLTVHARNSLDDNGMAIISYTHVGAGFDNAYWHPTQQKMYYGDGDTYFSPLTSLDVCGHEMGHGICQYTSNLDYSYGSESSALNEGFSDIWGASVEAWGASGLPGKDPWLTGEEITLQAPYYLRSMSNPSTGLFTPSASSYGDAAWNNDPDAHYRSGVIGHWYYLLSVGGSGTNTLGISYSVAGITINKAEKIAYLTEQLLNTSSDYAMARTMSIQAATTLYGACSNEVAQVKNAWHAVGIGSPVSTGTTTVTISTTASTPVCQGDIFTASCPYFSDAIDYQWSGNNLSITSGQGTNNVTVQATGTGIGSTTLSVVITNACGQTIGQGPVVLKVGPQWEFVKNDPQPVKVTAGCISQTAHITVVPATGATSYVWQIEEFSNPSTVIYTSPLITTSTNQLTYTVNMPAAITSGIVHVYALSPCGQSATLTSQRISRCKGNGRIGNGDELIVQNLQLSAYPNPAHSNFLVQLQSGSSKIELQIKEVRIYDKLGTISKVIRYSNNRSSQQVTTTGLKPDIYTVSAFDGKAWISTKLIVQ